MYKPFHWIIFYNLQKMKTVLLQRLKILATRGLGMRTSFPTINKEDILANDGEMDPYVIIVLTQL